MHWIKSLQNTFTFILAIAFLAVNLSGYKALASPYFVELPSLTGKTAILSEILHNPALNTMTNATQFVGIVSPSKFGLSELQNATLIVATPVFNDVTVGSKVRGYGNELYNKFSAELFTAYQFNDDLTLAFSLSSNRLNIKNVNTYNVFDFGISGYYNFNEYLNIGFNFINIADSRLIEESFSQRFFTLGIGFDTQEDLLLELGSLVFFENMTSFIFSAKYCLIDEIAVKIAYLSKPNTLDFGAMLDFPNLPGISLISQYNSMLGFSHSFGLLYRW